MLADSDIQTAKSTLREQAHAQRAAISAHDRAEAAQNAAAHFFAQIPLQLDQVIAAYWPIRDEIDSKPVLSQLMDAGHVVCLPAVLEGDVPLTFRQWELGAALYEAGFGTLGPSENAPVHQPDVVIIPLLGFDRTGTRLGYGKGHYDRSIAEMSKKPLLVGYAFAAQELVSIPREKHDVPLDFMVTETGVTQF